MEQERRQSFNYTSSKQYIILKLTGYFIRQVLKYTLAAALYESLLGITPNIQLNTE
jgi:hypothetical protein